MKKYPNKTTKVIAFDSLIRQDKETMVSEYLSTRMVKAANMSVENEFIGWQLIVPKRGPVDVSMFSSKEFDIEDMKWIAENIATLKVSHKVSNDELKGKYSELYEMYLPIQDNNSSSDLGFISDNDINLESKNIETEFSKWPVRYSTQLSEIIEAIRESGGILRSVVGKANAQEQLDCKNNLIKSYNVRTNIDFIDYLGHPVKTRFLLLLPKKPSIRLLTVLEEAVAESELRYIGSLNKKTVLEQWNNPLKKANILPDYASRIMLLEPIAFSEVTGVKLVEKKVKPIAASHKNSKSKNAVVIGKAIDTTGKKVDISIADMDLRRHMQIIGQTGTGKSTLLTTVVHNALMTGHGCTLFDPHGTTVDAILKTIPDELKHKVRVIRIGDAENPVPLNIWDSDDLEKEERNINDICELFTDIFDPKREGIVGPRYEKWFSVFSKASIALLGRRSSFESIALLSQNPHNMKLLSGKIRNKYPFLADTVYYEYATDKGGDSVSVINWYVSKFQKLTSVEQLRKTLGAGTNALDFENVINTDKITLIDLASPIIGTDAARVVGTMIMMKLWKAIMERGQSKNTHMVVVDEASLFQTNPMPRMLAEGRKFGLSMILCHQHTAQLSNQIKEALESNSANLLAFRLSAKDAYNASIRFDNESFQTKLTRLDAFNAIASISVDGKQTRPFSLETVMIPNQKDCERIKKEIEKASVDELVEPYRCIKALTNNEIMNILREPVNDTSSVNK